MRRPTRQRHAMLKTLNELKALMTFFAASFNSLRSGGSPMPISRSRVRSSRSGCAIDPVTRYRARAEGSIGGNGLDCSASASTTYGSVSWYDSSSDSRAIDMKSAPIRMVVFDIVLKLGSPPLANTRYSSPVNAGPIGRCRVPGAEPRYRKRGDRFHVARKARTK